MNDEVVKQKNIEGMLKVLKVMKVTKKTRDFLVSIEAWFKETGFLTEKQYQALCDIYEKP